MSEAPLHYFAAAELGPALPSPSRPVGVAVIVVVPRGSKCNASPGIRSPVRGDAKCRGRSVTGWTNGSVLSPGCWRDSSCDTGTGAIRPAARRSSPPTRPTASGAPTTRASSCSVTGSTATRSPSPITDPASCSPAQSRWAPLFIAAAAGCQPEDRRAFGVDFSSTSAILVCQPGPVAFQLAITSGGNRNDSSRRGCCDLGRPLRTSFSPRYMSAPAIHSSVISGGSLAGGEVRPEPFRFALMTMPHADDAPGRTSWRPDKHDQSRIEHPDRHKSRLTVVEAVIDAREVNAREDLLRPAHVETPLCQRALPLRRVTGDAHGLNVATIIQGVNFPYENGCRLIPLLRNGGRAPDARDLLAFFGPDHSWKTVSSGLVFELSCLNSVGVR